MKKLLAVIFSLLLALALFSCGDTEEQNDSENGTTSSTAHTHAYGEWVVVTLPGCETEGEEKRECGCGDIQTQPVASLGHTERVLERREPTCSVAGLTEGKDCSECGAILVAQAEIPTLSHTEKVLEYKAPTCTETGLTEGKMCTDCGETLLAQDIIPASHTEETVEGYAATCYETGLTDGKKCTVCGETTLEQEIIPISHVSEIVPAVEPDCYNTGLTEGKRCAICKTPLIPQYEVPQKHEPTVVEGYAPDCFNDGKKDGISCSLCGKVIQEQEIIPAHHELVLIPGKIATCTETGLTNGYECSVCKNVIIEQEEIPYTLHNFVNGNCTHCTITEFSQGFEYTLSEDGTYYILSGRGTCKDLKVIIPEMYMGKPVKEISSACFSSDYNLISIVIPSTIEKIGSNGFTYAYRLIEVYNLSTHINLVYGEPTGLYSVAKAIHTALDEESVLKQHGDFIFAELTMGGASLVAYTGNDAKVVLPNSYNDQKYKIHSYAFNDCRKMVSVTVPNGVAEVGTGAFSRCISLVEVYYDAGMQLEFNGSWWQGDLGKYALVINEHTNPESIINFVDDFVFVTHEGENYLVTYVGNEKHLTLPKDYKGQSYTIIKYAFENLDVESLVISSGVKAIEKSAFAQSKSLKEIIFEEGVVSIGDRAFAESGIRKIVLPNSLTQMGTNLFANCENLGCVVLGNGINTIPAYTFYSCSNLVSITLPSSLTSIADTAFFIYASNGTESADPYKLKEIINHSSLVLTIGGKDNGGIAKYAQVIYTAENDTASAIIKDNDFAFLKINEKYYLASYLGSDKHITLPKDIEGNSYEIIKYAFRDKKFLYSVVIPEGVTAIGDYAFRNCLHLEEITIAGTVKSIGDYAFYSCPFLVSVTLNEGLETIGEYVFSYASALESLVIPKSVVSIGKYMFRYAESIKSIVLLDPDNWYITSTKGASSGIDQKSRTDAEANASLAKEKYYWYKKAN